MSSVPQKLGEREKDGYSTVMTTYAEHRQARFAYTTLEKYEGGLVLMGTEVKAIREGNLKLQGSFLRIMSGELWLIGAHLGKYSKDGRETSLPPERNRKVLVTKKELLGLHHKLAQKGLTLVPFSVYTSGRRLKLSFGLCRGKRAPDKREALRERDIRRDTARALRGRDEE